MSAVPDDEVVDEGNPQAPALYIAPMERTGPSVAAAQHALRVRAALEARAHGFEYYQIAEELGVAERTAKDLVAKGLKDTHREAADEVRKLELKRLDMMMQVYFKQAMEGHGPSVDRVLVMMERRARIEGIDAPLEIDYASIRNQFFQRLRQVLPPEQVVQVLQAFAEGKA